MNFKDSINRYRRNIELNPFKNRTTMIPKNIQNAVFIFISLFICVLTLITSKKFTRVCEVKKKEKKPESKTCHRHESIG